MKVIKQKANPAVTEQDFQFNPSFGPTYVSLKQGWKILLTSGRSFTGIS